MRHRIFIAINLSESIKKQLSDYQFKWLELPCRWTKRENLHITLAFLGYLSNEELLEVCKIAKEVTSRHKPFFINFNKIIYGPPKQTPRMVWVEGTCPELVEGKKIDRLSYLQNDLQNALNGLSAELESEKGRGYTLHITLARIKQWEFRIIEPEERPEINEEINLSFEVKSIEVMESQLKRGGSEYTILESFPLKI